MDLRWFSIKVTLAGVPYSELAQWRGVHPKQFSMVASPPRDSNFSISTTPRSPAHAARKKVNQSQTLKKSQKKIFYEISFW